MPERMQHKQNDQFVLSQMPLAVTAAPHDRALVSGPSDTEAASFVLSGTVARTFAQSVIHPLDTLKTWQQAGIPYNRTMSPSLPARGVLQSSSGGGVSTLVRAPPVALEISPLWKSLYLGFTGTLLGTVPMALVYFCTYHAVRNVVKQHAPERHQKTLTQIVPATAGALASALFRVPGDVLRHRVQAYLYPDVFTALRCTLRSQGLAGLYSGFGPTLMRDVPEIAIQFFLYDQIQGVVSQYLPACGSEKPHLCRHLLVGGVSGAVAAACTTPLDVLKTNQQCGAGTGLWGILATRGPRGLFAGLGPRVLQTAVMSAVFFAAFEWLKDVSQTALRQLDATPLDLLSWRSPHDKIGGDGPDVRSQVLNNASYPLIPYHQPLAVAALWADVRVVEGVVMI